MVTVGVTAWGGLGEEEWKEGDEEEECEKKEEEGGERG